MRSDPKAVPGGRLTGAVLLLNAVAAAAAAIVLAVSPATIPATVGVRVSEDAHLLPYLLAAAELAIAALALRSGLSPVADIRKVGIEVLLVFHAGSAIADAGGFTAGANMGVFANLAVRLAMILALLWCRLLIDRGPR